MKTYICRNCGHIENTDNLEKDFVCPKCGGLSNQFDMIENQIGEDEIDAIIDSVIEDANDIDNATIVNNIDEERSIKISNNNSVIEKIQDKCINCGLCRKTCEKIVNIKYDLSICKEPICIGCGQCILSCPSSSIISKTDYKEIKEIIDLNEKIVIAILSPGVTASLNEILKIDEEKYNEKKVISSLKKLGFDFVFDESFGNDLLIVEETAELIERIKNKKNLPLFTSSCPSWVKYCEIYHPELLNNLSSCKSPIDMQCTCIKNYFCSKKGFDPAKIVCVLITPCTGRKMEIKEYNSSLDYAITVPELGLLIKDENIKVDSLEEREFDKIVGVGSGCGSGFSVSGGQSESIIRTLYRIMSKKNISKKADVFDGLKESKGIKEATIIINRSKINVAVIEQMENLETILRDNYYKNYHLIEVMNCNSGCIGGGGQPITNLDDITKCKENRKKYISKIDKIKEFGCAHENDEVKDLYKEFLEKPLSEKAISNLHRQFKDKSEMLRNLQM